jgi:hypothetical protein
MINTRSQACIASATMLAALALSTGAARAETDASLAQVFDAVCLKPLDAGDREAAARSHGLRIPPASFKEKPAGDRDAKLEFNLWKALDERMLFAFSQIQPFPGTKDLAALTCQVVLSPGGPDALADAAAVLGAPVSAGALSRDGYAFEEGPEGRRFLDADDEAAMSAALASGRLRVVRLERSKSSDDADMMMLLRPLAP